MVAAGRYKINGGPKDSSYHNNKCQRSGPEVTAMQMIFVINIYMGVLRTPCSLHMLRAEPVVVAMQEKYIIYKNCFHFNEGQTEGHNHA